MAAIPGPGVSKDSREPGVNDGDSDLGHLLTVRSRRRIALVSGPGMAISSKVRWATDPRMIPKSKDLL